MKPQQKAAAAQAAAAQAAAREQAAAAAQAAQAAIDAITAAAAAQKETKTKAVSIARQNLVNDLKEVVNDAKSLSSRFKVLRQKFPTSVSTQILEWQSKGTKVNQNAVQRILVQGDIKLFANFMKEEHKALNEEGKPEKKYFTEAETVAILKRAVCVTNEQIEAFDLERAAQAAQ